MQTRPDRKNPHTWDYGKETLDRERDEAIAKSYYTVWYPLLDGLGRTRLNRRFERAVGKYEQAGRPEQYLDLGNETHLPVRELLIIPSHGAE